MFVRACGPPISFRNRWIARFGDPNSAKHQLYSDLSVGWTARNLPIYRRGDGRELRAGSRESCTPIAFDASRMITFPEPSPDGRYLVVTIFNLVRDAQGNLVRATSPTPAGSDLAGASRRNRPAASRCRTRPLAGGSIAGSR